VAPEAYRQGDFSGAGVTIIDPATGQPFAGNRIPQSRFSPVARAILADQNLYPLPNRPGDLNNYVTGSSEKIRTHQGDFKLDYNASDKDRMFARVSYQRYKSEPERAPLPSQLAGTNDSPFFGLAFNWTRTVSTNSVNELLVGFTRVKFETGERNDWAGIGDANARSASPAASPAPA
jgi:hypothetical protein